MWTLVTLSYLRVYIRVLEPVASRFLLGGLEYDGFVDVYWSVMSLTPAGGDALFVCGSLMSLVWFVLGNMTTSRPQTGNRLKQTCFTAYMGGRLHQVRW